MSLLYTNQTKGHITLSRGTATYISRVPESVTIMADIYTGPKYQKDIVQNTNLAGYRVQSILSQLVSRGMAIKTRKTPLQQIYLYDLTVVAKLWMVQHYPNMIQNTPKTGVTV